LKQTLFSKNETLSIIRFVAMELALKHGADTPLYSYIYKGLPVFVSTTKIDGFQTNLLWRNSQLKK
jgi:hypothetical protein